MTRQERAIELRAGGATLHQIAAKFGIAVSTALRWTDPEQAVKAREHSRTWKEQNYDRKREYDRFYVDAHRHPCDGCGRLIKQHNVTCQACIAVRADQKAREFVSLWNDGAQLKQIAASLGWSMGHVKSALHRYREQGYDLPYRYSEARREALRKAVAA